MNHRQRLDALIDQIRFARQFTLTLLADVSPEDWYRMPEPRITHIAWQAGHLAVIENLLVFKRVLEPSDHSPSRLPDGYPELFGKGSQPTDSDPKLPAPAEILQTMAAIHDDAITRLEEADEAILDDPVTPHPAFSDKAGVLRWCADHEFMHAGQIALLRRELGYAPLR